MTSKPSSILLKLLRRPALIVGMGSAAIAVNGDLESKAATDIGTDGLEPLKLPNRLNSTAEDVYAGHRSHSSHASHGSHRSSSGGGYSAPRVPSTPSPRPRRSTPSYESVPSATGRSTSEPVGTTTIPSTEPNKPVPKPSKNSTTFMVLRVQAALMRLGHYSGDIDGILGPKTRAALQAFQLNKGIKQTGRMDIETLTALGIQLP